MSSRRKKSFPKSYKGAIWAIGGSGEELPIVPRFLVWTFELLVAPFAEIGIRSDGGEQNNVCSLHLNFNKNFMK